MIVSFFSAILHFLKSTEKLTYSLRLQKDIFTKGCVSGRAFARITENRGVFCVHLLHVHKTYMWLEINMEA